MGVKPISVAKDIAINLTNVPTSILLGSSQYPLKFMIMNLKASEKILVITFEPEGLQVDTPVKELKIGPQGREEVVVTATPTCDGEATLRVNVIEKRTITYTETMLEGAPEPEAPVPAASAVVESPAPPAAVKPPVKSPVKPPVKSPAPPAAVKSPVKPPVKSPAPPAGIKPVSGASKEAKLAVMEKEIQRIKDEYMAVRSGLQSMQAGSEEYKSTYAHALELKENYDTLKARYEAGDVDEEETPEEIIASLKEMMNQYNTLRAELKSLDPSDPRHSSVKEKALAIYKEYNDKKSKAQESGIIP